MLSDRAVNIALAALATIAVIMYLDCGFNKQKMAAYFDTIRAKFLGLLKEDEGDNNQHTARFTKPLGAEFPPPHPTTVGGYIPPVQSVVNSGQPLFPTSSSSSTPLGAPAGESVSDAYKGTYNMITATQPMDNRPYKAPNDNAYDDDKSTLANAYGSQYDKYAQPLPAVTPAGILSNPPTTMASQPIITQNRQFPDPLRPL